MYDYVHACACDMYTRTRTTSKKQTEKNFLNLKTDMTLFTELISLETYNLFLWIMAAVAVVVFVALYFVEAGYGYLFNPKFGFPVPNRVAWVLMECPVFIVMALLWWMSDYALQTAPLVLFIIFQTHYFQRSFIFPLLIRGKSKMPAGIMLMGMVFNTLNAVMQGGWIFYYGPERGYYDDWMSKPYIYIGIAVWLFGFITNLHSDYVIRHLRKPGDTKHYIPRGGMFRYVSSANYFGEFMEWVGFAIASWSWAGVVFALWTFANLGPRSASLYKRYEKEFGEEFTKLGRKRIIPFIY